MNRREKICLVLSMSLLAIFFPSAEWFHHSSPWWTYRFVAGFVLGSIGAMAYEVFLDLIVKYRQGGMAAIEPKLAWRPFLCLFYCAIILMGLIAWVVGWEGKNTGIFYGIGAAIGALLMSFGLGAALKREREIVIPKKWTRHFNVGKF